ncbi:MAG: hypothetical protein BWY75_03250 [bacterium ADurb.Bin425]|nr:MAG: hypothetical protein BWY75_03250 [bacterium ADurb.Bin425]
MAGSSFLPAHPVRLTNKTVVRKPFTTLLGMDLFLQRDFIEISSLCSFALNFCDILPVKITELPV